VSLLTLFTIGEACFTNSKKRCEKRRDALEFFSAIVEKDG
jgi:hypothetical protein